MQPISESTAPSAGKFVQTLRDGYWDRTELIELPDGTRRVRKISKGASDAGPWGQSSLRREIAYLKNLSGEIADYFPRVLAAWDDDQGLAYEMSYFENTAAVSDSVQTGQVTQDQAERLQDHLAHIVFYLVHVPVAVQQPLSVHVCQVIDQSLTQLARDDLLSSLIHAPTVTINGQQMAGPRAAMQEISQSPSVLQSIDQQPSVRLHGDFFLENILLPRTWPQGQCRLALIDPVSVAGVFQGHPLFDLVKYESYASGELLALRSEKIDVEGFDHPQEHRYRYSICTEDPSIEPFQRIDWRARFRAAYVARYGPVNAIAYDFLDAYFALVMAICTHGKQRRGRLLKSALALHAALNPTKPNR